MNLISKKTVKSWRSFCKNLLSPYVVTGRIPLQNLVPVYNATLLYVPEFNNYYSDISKIRPNLRPYQIFRITIFYAYP